MGELGSGPGAAAVGVVRPAHERVRRAVASPCPAPLAPAREPLLFAELPALRTLPFEPFAHLPTPVEPARACAAYLGRDDVWMKRDDLVSPLYGGNKVRRYELLLAAALATGKRRVLTVGGTGSTQVTATALFGRALGLGVRAVAFEQPLTRFVRRALCANAAAGAELVPGGGYLGAFARTVRELLRARDTAFVAPGASSPLANLGYVDALFELDLQVRAGLLPRPDVIVLPTGSAGTLAGLLAGAWYLDWPLEIVGVAVAARAACNRATVGLVAWRTRRLLARHAPGLGRRRHGPRFRLFHGALGPGYGHPTPDAVAALPEIERLTGAPGEVTYSAKALVGARSLCRDPRYRGKNVLLWNTLSSILPPAPESARALLHPGFARCFDGELAV
ncbi:MAG: pyridoxal-phosphate dependent enzyme [Polyangiaceae bacterium]|nr:pyridoxal-phosphate dependent enzyme [Polyangiaceae bacterium]